MSKNIYTAYRLDLPTGKYHSSDCKGKLKLIMQEEIKNSLAIEQSEISNIRNSYHQCNLDTQYGPNRGSFSSKRSKTKNFKHSLFAPYQRYKSWDEERTIEMY